MLSRFLSNNRADPVYSTIYTLVLVWLFCGLIRSADVPGLALFGLFFSTFVLVSIVLFCFGASVTSKVIIGSEIFRSFNRYLVTVAIFFVPAHWIALGSIPIVDAALLDSQISIAIVRQSITDNGGDFFNYGSSIFVISVMPFILLAAYIKKSRCFFWLALYFLLYAMSLLQKSYVFAVLLPVAVYALIVKKMRLAAGLFGLSCLAMLFLVVVTNPHLRPSLSSQTRSVSPVISDENRPSIINIEPKTLEVGPLEAKNELSSLEKVLAGISGVVDRVVFVPGEVVAHWFQVIPSSVSYAYGCGYRPVARIVGCDHINFPRVVWRTYNGELAAQGLSGTMNAASFMEDYGNFGIVGLVFGGGVLAFWFWIIGQVFIGFRRIGVALNILPILYLSSSAFSSLLLSGGWLFTIALFCVFRAEFVSNR